MMTIREKLRDNLIRNQEAEALRKQEETNAKLLALKNEVDRVHQIVQSVTANLEVQVRSGKHNPRVRLTSEEEDLLRRSGTFESSFNGYRFRRYETHIEDAYYSAVSAYEARESVKLKPVYEHDGMGMKSWIVMTLVIDE
jgi:hypothetical protein